MKCGDCEHYICTLQGVIVHDGLWEKTCPKTGKIIRPDTPAEEACFSPWRVGRLKKA